MLRLLLATRNRHKVVEISAILSAAGAPVELVGLESFPGAPEVDETGETLEENAILKARSAVDFTKLPAVADDTGLFVDALGGEPGVKAARYSGEGATYESNNKKLLAALADVPPEKRTAKFACVVALISPGQPPLTFRGQLPGRILAAPRGANGFGYDPIFVPDSSGPTLAEMESGEKNRISHRSAAFRRLAAFLKSSAP